MKVSILRRAVDRLTFRRTGICLPPVAKSAPEPVQEDERASSFTTLMDGLKDPRKPVQEPTSELASTDGSNRRSRILRDLPDNVAPLFHYEIVGETARRYVPFHLLKDAAPKGVVGVRSIAADIRAVTEAPAKGVTIEVISDDQIPELDPGYIAPEVIVSGPRACELQQAAQEAMQEVDMRFWDAFFNRICQTRDTVAYEDDEQLLHSKGNYTKGYFPILDAQTIQQGIVHVTKNDINAIYLVDAYKGVWRAVSATGRFAGGKVLDAEMAKNFLNGRY